MTLAALRHPDAEVRRQCIAALGGEEVDRARAVLLEMLDDPDWRVRREVALAIGRASDVDGCVAPLVDAVERGDVARRNAAMEALRQIGTRATTSLLARLDVAEARARRFLVELLAHVGDERVVAPLEALLFGEDANVAHAAAESLAHIAAPGAEAALVRALDSPEAVVRLAVLQAFAARKRPLPWTRLAPLTEDPICRRAALLSAAYSPESEALDAILRALVSGGPIAGPAAIALSHRIAAGLVPAPLDEHHSSRVAFVLIELAERGSSYDARRAALRCLRVAPIPEAVAVVLSAIDQPETSSVAEEVLESFGADSVEVALRCAPGLGRAAVVSLVRWAAGVAEARHARALVALSEQWLDSGARSVALWETVAALGDREAAERLASRIIAHAATLEAREIGGAIERLVRCWPEEAARLSAIPVTSSVGLAAAVALARVGLAVDVAALRDALSASEPQLRAGALRALAALDARATMDALTFALADEDPLVQAAAAEVLGERGEGREMLVASLAASDARVRRAAITAVARWPGGGERVRPLLSDREPSVVLRAMEALGPALTAVELESLCAHPDADVVTQALATLRSIDARRAARVAEALLSHAVWSVRLEAVRALVDAGADGRDRLHRARDHERDELVVEAIDAALAREERSR